MRGCFVCILFIQELGVCRAVISQLAFIQGWLLEGFHCSLLTTSLVPRPFNKTEGRKIAGDLALFFRELNLGMRLANNISGDFRAH